MLPHMLAFETFTVEETRGLFSSSYYRLELRFYVAGVEKFSVVGIPIATFFCGYEPYQYRSGNFSPTEFSSFVFLEFPFSDWENKKFCKALQVQEICMMLVNSIL